MKNQLATISSSFLHGSWNHYLIYTIIALFGMYSFFIAGTVININERKDVRVAIRDMQSLVSELEINYFSTASTIDIEQATAFGFVESTDTRFTYTNPTTDTVAMVQ